MNEELKPCPFCGSKAEEGCMDPGAPYPGGYYYVSCSNEDCTMTELIACRKAYATEAESAMKEVRAIWNTRAST